MSKVSIVGGLIGDSLDGVTASAMQALNDANVVIYPGDWISEPVRATFGGRLKFGRSISATDVEALVASHASAAILYAGDPTFFTGRHDAFPSAHALVERLRTSGHDVHWFPSYSTAQAAMMAAGLTVPALPGSALTVAAPMCRFEGGEVELERIARTDATLALMWAEDRGEDAWRILQAVRGGSCQAHLVKSLGTADQSVTRGSLDELQPDFAALTPPAVVLVEAGSPESAATRMSRQPVAAVIGSARATEAEITVAESLGRALVDAGFRVVTGGLGGIMEAACRGAHQSHAYVPGTTIGVVPTYEPRDANPFCDVVIATGMNHARNVVVVGSADVVVAVSGKSGTLSEIALAWTLGRPVVAVGDTGWAAELGGRPIDDRRDDVIHGPFSSVTDAVDACAKLTRDRSEARREF